MATGMKMMCEWIEKSLEFVQQLPSATTTTMTWTSLGVVSVTTLLLFILRLKLRKPDTILLTGLTGSGKTVLFYQLRDGCCKQKTIRSEEPNEERFILHSETSWISKVRPVNVVDLPGDSHLQSATLVFLRKAAGIVIVVDATEILWNFPSVSKYIYDILTNTVVIKKKIPLLILCNKTDKLNAHSKEFIARQLEKEINKLCSSRKEFSFSDCHTQVTVSEASGLTGDIAQLEIFIRKYVKY